MEQHAQLVQLLLAFLSRFLPNTLVAKHDFVTQIVKTLVDVEPEKYGPLLATTWNEASEDYLRLRLYSKSVIEGAEPREVLVFASPARLEKCATPEQVLSTVTLLGLIHAPFLRGILYAHGYHLGWEIVRRPAETPH